MSVRRGWLLVAVLAVVLAVLALVAVRSADRRSDASLDAPPPAPPSAGPPTFYATRTPYPPAPVQVAAPAGLVPVFAEHVGRHGSRTSTAGDHGERAGRLWQRAADSDALTPLGARLGPVLAALDTTTARLGVGRLTALGRAEQEAIGEREGQRLAPMFAQAEAAGSTVRIVTSGRTRTRQSAESFVAGLTASRPGLDVQPPRADPRLLYFDHTDPAYRDFLAHDKTWRAAYAAALRDVDLPATAAEVLQRLYTPAFVAAVEDPVAEAESVYERYRSAPALVRDLETPVDMTPFLLPGAAATFAFVEDARYFYSRGPGVTGDGRSHRPAQVLLDDFFAAADRRLAGGDTVAVYRFAHAEQIVPLAALLGLPGSTPLDSAEQIYSWDSSTFRTANVAPLAANVRWTVWRDGAGTALVSVDHDEAPTTLGRSCRPEPALPTFYRLDELRRCLAG